MPIKLNGSTSGYVQIDATAIAGTTQITLPAITGGSFIVSDSSGNVGIGTTSPQVKLQIGSSSTSTQAENIDMWGALAGSNGDIGRLRFYNVNANGNKTVAQVSGARDGNNFGGALLFSTGTQADTTLTERVRIDSSGVVQVGGTTVANTTGYVNSRTNTRAWVRWVGSSGAVTASYNVSSVTRNSTGNYTVNFTTSLADANYAPIGMTAGAAAYGSFGVYMQQTSAPTAASCAVTTLSNAGAAVDCIANQLVIFGN